MQYELNKQNIRAATALKPWVLVGARGCSRLTVPYQQSSYADSAVYTILFTPTNMISNIIDRPWLQPQSVTLFTTLVPLLSISLLPASHVIHSDFSGYEQFPHLGAAPPSSPSCGSGRRSKVSIPSETRQELSPLSHIQLFSVICHSANNPAAFFKQTTDSTGVNVHSKPAVP